jgi:hypothetical protein
MPPPFSDHRPSIIDHRLSPNDLTDNRPKSLPLRS